MKFFDIFPTFAEAPYSYIVVPIIFVCSIIGFYNKSFFHALILHPYEIARGKRVHTLLTSALVHRNWRHLLFNCMVIFGLGYDTFGNLKQESGITIASLVTPLLFIMMIILPNLFQYLQEKGNFIHTSIGASNLTFGLFGFSFLYFPLQPTHSFIIPFINNSAQYWLAVLLLLFFLLKIPKSKINKRLHLLAYLTGSLLAIIVRPQSFLEIQTVFKIFL
ncbi:rhomboid family intramembrane serine protease [Sphingobacterium sp.]|uniref:rhomboid family intramembrane serine protease n=1 Tax=Sphingobacterium sp. TaxID=341027 RepID=UPI00289E54CC|nr:rhomboid family intramembrane serine protease [Sphingobacterium sp.]